MGLSILNQRDLRFTNQSKYPNYYLAVRAGSSAKDSGIVPLPSDSIDKPL